MNRYLLMLFVGISLGTLIRYDDLTIKRCNNTSDFSIHGWWPEYNNHSWPSWCNPSKYKEFNSETILPIKNLLNSYWYSCPGWPSAYSLWQHEWEKHGTCLDSYSVIEYFNHTINTFLLAKENNWYGCCGDIPHWNELSQCMIPFSTNSAHTKWLGYCHKYFLNSDHLTIYFSNLLYEIPMTT